MDTAADENSELGDAKSGNKALFKRGEGRPASLVIQTKRHHFPVGVRT